MTLCSFCALLFVSCCMVDCYSLSSSLLRDGSTKQRLSDRNAPGASSVGHAKDAASVVMDEKGHLVTEREQSSFAQRSLGLHLDERMAKHLEIAPPTLSVPHPESCVLPPNARWCKVSLGFGQFQMAVYEGDDIVSQSICATGTWELRHDDISGLGKPGHALDIGANVGFYSFVLASAGWNVTSFEPIPRNTALIKASLCQNPLLQSRISLHEVGLGQKDDRCIIFSGDINVGDGITQCGSNPENAIHAGYTKRADITIRRLDDILSEQNVQNIDFVKMDVEGFECQVMAGAPTLLSKFKPKFIQSEVWPHMRDCSPNQYLSSFADAHYKVTKDRQCHLEDASAPTQVENRYMCFESGAKATVASMIESPSYHRSIVLFKLQYKD